MSRKIKFRAFSEHSGMWDWEKLTGQRDYAPHLLSCLYSHDGWHVMQFTGLLDKNGREIYEGDIVIAWSQGSKGTFEIKWRQEGSPSFILYPAWQHREMWYLSGSKNKDGTYSDTVEVIGNIHEKPELITRDHSAL